MVQERQTRRDKLRGQLEAVDAEIRVLQEALARMGGEQPAPTKRPKPQPSAGSTRERALNETWRDALCFIGATEPASLDAIMAWSDANNKGIKRNTLRSQTSIYVERGWLTRMSEGVFGLTAEGAAKCGFAGRPRNDEADAAGTDVGLSSEGDNLFRDPAHPA